MPSFGSVSEQNVSSGYAPEAPVIRVLVNVTVEITKNKGE